MADTVEERDVPKERDPVTCYVSAPLGTNVDWIRDALRKRGVRLASPSAVVGDDLYATVGDIIRRCDLVIGVLMPAASAGVMFELGMAAALKRRIVVFTTPDDTNVDGLAQHLVLRVDPGNREAVEFALDQVLAAPRQGDTAQSAAASPSAGLGADVEPMIRRLRDALDNANPRELERVVVGAILAFGHEAAVRSGIQDQDADMAVWSDRLVENLGCPLLVEVKHGLGPRARPALQRYAQTLKHHGAGWGLLVYGKGPKAPYRWWSDVAPTVLTISAHDLLERMRSESFADIVMSLRNRRVHIGDY